MALLYGGLVLLVGVSLLFTTVVLLDQTLAGLTFFRYQGDLVGHLPNGQVVTLQSVRSPADRRGTRARSNLLHTGLIYFAIIVAIGAAGGYLLAKQALRPIAKVTRTAKQLSTETLDQRINLGGPDDELRELADTFDEMLGRLDAAFDSQRLFVANASHELRTPLAVIRTELDVTSSDPDATTDELRQMAEIALGATERAEKLVSSLLVLARLQAGHRGRARDQRGRRPVPSSSRPCWPRSTATPRTARSPSRSMPRPRSPRATPGCSSG